MNIARLRLSIALERSAAELYRNADDCPEIDAQTTPNSGLLSRFFVSNDECIEEQNSIHQYSELMLRKYSVFYWLSAHDYHFKQTAIQQNRNKSDLINLN